MNSDSWHDRLAALRGTLGPAPEPEAAPEATENTNKASWTDQKGRVDVILDRKGRAGKSATIVAGFTVADDAVAALAALLRRSLGTGGSSRGGEILIQGDRRDDVVRILAANGIKARKI